MRCHNRVQGWCKPTHPRRSGVTVSTAFRSAVEHHPDYADAWNNLAQVLLDQGKRREAAAAIAKAVALGGEFL